MRTLVILGLVGILILGVTAGAAPSQTPIRKFDREGKVDKVVPATAAQKEKGTLATVTLEGKAEQIVITKETVLQLQNGKLVEKATVDAIKEGCT